MKRIIKILLVVVVILGGMAHSVYADSTVGLTIRSGEHIIFSGTVPLEPAGSIELEDSNGTTHPLDARSVLSVVHDADVGDDTWDISNLEYFDSFSAFYLKCLESSFGEDCDNWQYVVDGTSSVSSMDQNILSGGENVYVYFGPQNRITLGSHTITTNDAVTLTAENYDYENNSWTPRTGATVGLTQPNPSDPFNPIEILTTQLDTIGQATFMNVAVGSYNVGIKEDFYFPTEPLTVTTYVPPTGGGSGGYGNSNTGVGAVLGATTAKQFDLKKAFDFLISKQGEDGSFGEEIYTDWSGVALSSGNYQKETIKLIKFLSSTKAKGTMLTDYERQAMVLMTLGLNPYNTNGENYIGKILAGFDGKQFGDPKEDNDDIFALIVLRNAGYQADDKTLQSSLQFILERQLENGSWDESVDMTGAGIQALTTVADKSCFPLGSLSESTDSALPPTPPSCETPQSKELFSALGKAKEFLKQSQKETGGWANPSSTAWAVGGILALQENPVDWKVGDPANSEASNTPFSYFAVNQDADGGMKNEDPKNKLWETAYTITAYSGKTWNKLMQTYKKPAEGLVLGASSKVETKTTPPIKKALKPKLVAKIPVKTEPPASSAPIDPVEKKEPPTSQSNWFKKLLTNLWGTF